MLSNCLFCFRTHTPNIPQPKQPQPHPPQPPRCLLLGPAGAGKTAFLLHLKPGTPRKASPAGSNVEQIPITTRSSIVFSETAGTDRRHIRLHFLNPDPIPALAILFFLDVSAPLSKLTATLEDLVYSVTYARSRASGRLRYVGVVLNKQDLLQPEAERAEVVGKITQEVGEAMRHVEDTQLQREGALNWEVLNGGREGMNCETGAGVKEAFDAVAKAVHVVERAGLRGLVAAGATPHVLGERRARHGRG